MSTVTYVILPRKRSAERDAIRVPFGDITQDKHKLSDKVDLVGMGAASSSGLVDCVVDGDIQRLRTVLHDHDLDVKRAGDPAEGSAATKDSAWNLELEEAVHTVVASEIESGQHLQQLQIALELLLQARPEVWSSTASSLDQSENNNGNDTSATSNPAGWSACHRACATANLEFVVFVLHHHPEQFDLQTRDAFGLFPIDLVPPELLMSTEEMDDCLEAQQDSMKPATARSRRCLALHRLRERKAKLQDEQVRNLLDKYKATDTVKNKDRAPSQRGGCYVAFEPTREHLSIDQVRNMGHVHEREALLRVNYRLPRAEPFLNGYFQLIWRGLRDARSEEPNYDSRITRLRDEHDHILDQEASLQPVQREESREAAVQADEQHRSLDDTNVINVVEGFFPVDVMTLPSDSVCHVLFIACDKQMLHRTIALSTEGLAIQVQDLDSDDYYSDSTSDGDDEEAFQEQKQEENKNPGYTFFVGGEEFSHPNPVFAGQSFPDVPTFESFLRDLRLKRRLQQQQEQQEQGPDNQAREDEQSQLPVGKQQEAVQEEEEMVNKSDSTEVSKQDEEVRPAEKLPLNDNTDQCSEESQDDQAGQ